MDRPARDAQLPPLLEPLLAVHSASSTAWLADAAATAAERAIGALYGLLFLLDGSGQLAAERPASTDRLRRLAKLEQVLQTDLGALHFSTNAFPAVQRALEEGQAQVVQNLGHVLPLTIADDTLRAAQSRLAVARAWLAPLYRNAESAGLLLLLMPSASPVPLAHAEMLGRHAAVALQNLREREAGRKHGELDAVRWVYDEQRFMEELGLECRRSQRHGRPLSVLFVRLQNSDAILKRYGRFLADRILRQVAGQLAEAMRDTDFLGAVGADGFGALLVEADRNGAQRAEERLLAGLDVMKLQGAELPDLRVEFACASATMPDDGTSAVELAEVAQARLAVMLSTGSTGDAAASAAG